MDENGYVPKDGTFFAALEAEFDLPAESGSQLLHDFRSRFPEKCVPLPGLKGTLLELRATGYALGLITNGSERTQARAIAGLGLHELVDTVLISEVEKVRKPDPEIFARALERLGTDANQAVFVGDNPEADVRAALRCGMKAIWFRNDFWPPPELTHATVDALHEVPTVVAQWQSVLEPSRATA